ncbi:MAG: hypothetical protein PHD15_00900 [Clostridia bacterium]|nr:hypothetical protein [Clostridia bacterium]MDD4386309.1 hypothetical protein [Clostridia bacterium]
MLNLIKNKFMKNSIYDDISKVYDVIDINDNCILIRRLSILKQIHIYKVEPITILNITESISKNIITLYTEFLRSMNCDFQIYIENTEVNINSYFDNITLDDKNINKNKLVQKYKSELEKSLNENNIYINNYYIVLTVIDGNSIEEISKNIYNLCKIGVFIEKIEGKVKLDNFLYSKSNKVDNIC